MTRLWATAKTRSLASVSDQRGNRNSPVAYNRIITDLQFWDGRAGRWKSKPRGRSKTPSKWATPTKSCATIQGIDGYVRQFDKVFPDEGMTIDTIAKAIATFERAIVTGPAPYDYLEIVKSVDSQYDEDEIEEDLKEEEPELYTKYTTAKQVVKQKCHRPRSQGRIVF